MLLQSWTAPLLCRAVILSAHACCLPLSPLRLALPTPSCSTRRSHLLEVCLELFPALRRTRPPCRGMVLSTFAHLPGTAESCAQLTWRGVLAAGQPALQQVLPCKGAEQPVRRLLPLCALLSFRSRSVTCNTSQGSSTSVRWQRGGGARHQRTRAPAGRLLQLGRVAQDVLHRLPQPAVQGGGGVGLGLWRPARLPA